MDQKTAWNWSLAAGSSSSRTMSSSECSSTKPVFKLCHFCTFRHVKLRFISTHSAVSSSSWTMSSSECSPTKSVFKLYHFSTFRHVKPWFLLSHSAVSSSSWTVSSSECSPANPVFKLCHFSLFKHVKPWFLLSHSTVILSCGLDYTQTASANCMCKNVFFSKCVDRAIIWRINTQGS